MWKMCHEIPIENTSYRVEEDLLLRRSLGELDSESGSRRSAMSARRSFFRRYRKHQRSNSRDIKELASFSDASINSFSDSGNLMEDPPILTYQRVERLTGKANKYGMFALNIFPKLLCKSPLDHFNNYLPFTIRKWATEE